MEEDRAGLRRYARLASAGLEFAITVGLAFGLGWWADGKLKTSPGLTLVGLALGFTAGLYNLYRAVFGERKQ